MGVCCWFNFLVPHNTMSGAYKRSTGNSEEGRVACANPMYFASGGRFGHLLSDNVENNNDSTTLSDSTTFFWSKFLRFLIHTLGPRHFWQDVIVPGRNVNPAQIDAVKQAFEVAIAHTSKKLEPKMREAFTEAKESGNLWSGPGPY